MHNSVYVAPPHDYKLRSVKFILSTICPNWHANLFSANYAMLALIIFRVLTDFGLSCRFFSRLFTLFTVWHYQTWKNLSSQKVVFFFFAWLFDSSPISQYTCTAQRCFDLTMIHLLVPAVWGAMFLARLASEAWTRIHKAFEGGACEHKN